MPSCNNPLTLFNLFTLDDVQICLNFLACRRVYLAEPFWSILILLAVSRTTDLNVNPVHRYALNNTALHFLCAKRDRSYLEIMLVLSPLCYFIHTCRLMLRYTTPNEKTPKLCNLGPWIGQIGFRAFY